MSLNKSTRGYQQLFLFSVLIEANIGQIERAIALECSQCLHQSVAHFHKKWERKWQLLLTYLIFTVASVEKQFLRQAIICCSKLVGREIEKYQSNNLYKPGDSMCYDSNGSKSIKNKILNLKVVVWSFFIRHFILLYQILFLSLCAHDLIVSVIVR